MKLHIKSTVFALVIGFSAVVFVPGCASIGRVVTADEQTHVYMEGMMCPKCETVWVAECKRHGPRKVTRLSYSREMTCPDCDVMANSQLLKDGKVILHECPACKVTPKPIQPLDPEFYSEPSG